MKLALLGGKKLRKKQMPPRFSFGKKENINTQELEYDKISETLFILRQIFNF